MVEPVSLTIGVVVAALVTKAAEKAGEELTEGAAPVLVRLVGWLRKRFSGKSDDGALAALAQLEDAPDSPSRAAALARVVDERVQTDPEFRVELARLVEQVKAAGVAVTSVTQIASGDQDVQVADVQGSTVTVSFGGGAPSTNM